MPSESSHPIKKHVTTACTFCRRRKIKCDGKLPICTNCEVNSRTCKYNSEDDKRKLSSKKIIDSLNARIKQLEQTLDEHGIAIPPEPIALTQSPQAGDSPDQGNVDKPPDEALLGLSPYEDSRVLKNAAQSFQGNRPIEQPWVPQLPTPATTGDASSSDGDSMTDGLAAQMGSLKIAEDGQLRYYGPTSNLHIVHNGLFSLSRSTIRSVSEEGQVALQRAGVGNCVDPEIELHLTRLYFAWEDPSIHVVDEEMFYAEKQNWNSGATSTPFYSETLNNAICAVGACLSFGVKLDIPEPASEFFSTRAKALLDVEMDSPSVATVQALVVMSATEAAFTRDARGWLYSGMAVRLSADLGLHLDLAQQVRNGELTQREMDVRRTTFWGVFTHDNMWSMYVGRPWGINIRDISISRPPREIDAIRKKSWSPYGQGQEPSSPDTHLNLIDPVESCADANVSLCEMMRRISRTLYAGRKTPVSELLTFASDTRKEFSFWLDSLPEELQIDLANPKRIYLPHVLQLHMQFYVLSIFLHRPFFSRHLLRRTHLSPSAQTAEASQIRRLCISAAHSLIQTLRLYRKQHSLRQTNVQIVHLVFTASLVHVYSACASIGAEQMAAMNDLQFCCQALGEMGQAWRNATRALEVIICIKREWQTKAAAYAAASGKRPSEAGDGDAHRRRRQRTLDSGSQLSDPLTVPPLPEMNATNIPMSTVETGVNSTSDIPDVWHFLNGTDLNFGLGDEDVGGDEELLLLMDGFGDPGDNPFALGMTGSGTYGVAGNAAFGTGPGGGNGL